MPGGIEFNNKGSVSLKRLTSLPEGVKFNNIGYVYLDNVTEVPITTVVGPDSLLITPKISEGDYVAINVTKEESGKIENRKLRYSFSHQVTPLNTKIGVGRLPMWILGAPGRKWIIKISDSSNIVPSNIISAFDYHSLGIPNGIGWIGGTIDKDTIYITENQNDIVQNTKYLSKRYQQVLYLNKEKQIGIGLLTDWWNEAKRENRDFRDFIIEKGYIKEGYLPDPQPIYYNREGKPMDPEWFKYKSKIENLYKGWEYIFLSDLIKQIPKNIKVIRIPTSEYYGAMVTEAANVSKIYDKVGNYFKNKIVEGGKWREIKVEDINKEISGLAYIYNDVYIKAYIKTFIENMKKTEKGIDSDRSLAHDALSFIHDLKELTGKVSDDVILTQKKTSDYLSTGFGREHLQEIEQWIEKTFSDEKPKQDIVEEGEGGVMVNPMGEIIEESYGESEADRIVKESLKNERFKIQMLSTNYLLDELSQAIKNNDYDKKRVIEDILSQKNNLYNPNVKFLYSSEGEILGFSYGNKIYLNAERLSPNTIFEEAGHIWINWAKENEKDIYNSGLSLVRDSQYIKDVLGNPNYVIEALKQGKRGSKAFNNYIEEEALSKSIKDEGAKILNETRKKSFREWLKRFWGRIKELVGLNDMTIDEIKTLSLSEFSQGILKDILESEKPTVVKPDASFLTTEKESIFPASDLGIKESEPDQPIFKPFQLKLFALDKEGKRKKSKLDSQLEERLIQFLNLLGFKISEVSLKEMEEKTGVKGVVGAVLLFEKIVLLAKGKADSRVLAEEVGHVFESLIGEDNPLHKRMMDLVYNSDKYKEVLEEYEGVYEEENEELIKKLKKETIGKLLSDAIHDRLTEKSVSLKNVIKMIIERIKQLFRSADENYLRSQIKQVYGEAAEKILNIDIQGLNPIHSFKKEIYYSLDPQISKYEKILDKMIDGLKTRIAIARTKREQVGVKSFVERIKSLLEELNEISTTKGFIGFVKNAKEDIMEADKRFRNSIEEGKITSEFLMNLNDFIGAYDEIDNLSATVRYDKNMSENVRTRVLRELADLKSLKDDIKKEIRIQGVSIIAQFLKRFAGDRGPGKELDIPSLLELMEKDINFFERWLMSTADSGEPILALVDKAVKEQKAKARLSSLDFENTLIARLEEYRDHREADGIDINDDEELYQPMLERDKNGDLTGHMVSKYYSEYERQLIDAITVDKGESDAQYRTRRGKWSKENQWYNREMKTYNPKKKWLNPQYNELKQGIYKGTEVEEFYNFLVSSYLSSQEKIPEKFQIGLRLPNIKSNFVEQFKKKGGLKAVKDSAKDMIIRKESDTEYGQYTDESGRPLNFLPVHFVTRMKGEDVKELSYNIANSLLSFRYMADNYHFLYEIIYDLEMTKEYVSTRNQKDIDPSGKNLLNRITGKLGITSNSENYVKARMDDYFKAVLYGQTKKDEGSLKIFGLPIIDKAKFGDLIIAFSSLLNLGLNVFSSINNVVVAEAYQTIEAVAGEYFNGLEYLESSGIYLKELPGVMIEANSLKKTSKLGVLNVLFDTIQGFSKSESGIALEDTSLLRKSFSINNLFILMDIGEYEIQSRLMVAMTLNKKVTLENGSEISLWEAYSIDEDSGKAVLNKGVIDFSEMDLIRFTERLRGLNERLHGTYSPIDYSAFQRSVIGRLALQHRKWIVTGWNRRWEKTKYNERLENWVEGYYVTFGGFMGNVIRDIKKFEYDLIAADWEKLKSWEKSNIKRTITEIAYTALSFGFGLALMEALRSAGDDDDKKNLPMLILTYQMLRLNSELLFYINPIEAGKIVSNPAASISLVEKAYKLLVQLFDPLEEYKGELKIKKYSKDLVPVWNQIERLDQVPEMTRRFKGFFEIKEK